VAVVRSALEQADLRPALLCLEVTESLLMDDDHRTTAVLRELHALGVQLSIDDFATGHSSLARLRTLPFCELKIDRAFISEISADGDCGPIITAVVAMARALRLSVVAEGVETHVQLQALQRLGCDAVQGFLIARPAALAELRLERVPDMASTPAGAEDQLISS
jgi:EAL domain-containing protein (putative c-di-GMP-specific phosphodiesterase class I)